MPNLDIANRLGAQAVIDELRSRRPVFHSEADFQHAFGQVIHDLDPTLHVRLEVRQENAEYLDLLCFGAIGRTAIEFKYVTAGWQGKGGITGENFELRHHSATDLARRNFVFDIERLERFCAARKGTNGLAILLTNDASLWKEPRSVRLTRDHAFRIHEGVELFGTLEWAGGAYPPNTRHLAGRYRISWQDYWNLDGPNGKFRWLLVQVI